MRKLLACLLISPIMFAKEYTFTCVFTQNKDLVLSLLINTEDKYIFFGESDSPYNESWKETESSISAKKRESTTTYIAKFNKITGRFVYAGVYHPDYSSLNFELVYLCTDSNRLMP